MSLRIAIGTAIVDSSAAGGGGAAGSFFYFNGYNQWGILPSPWDTKGNFAAYGSITFTGEDTNFISSVPISEFGRIGPNYALGVHKNLRLTDTSPIQNTDVVPGDGVRSMQLQIMMLTSPASIKFDFKRKNSGSSFALLHGVVPSGQYAGNICSFEIKDNDDIVLTDAKGTSITLTRALADVGEDKHSSVCIEITETLDDTTLSTIRCIVDGTETVSVDNATDTFVFRDTAILPAGMYVQNLVVSDGFNTREWNYALNEAA